jgi:hypothetical protein
MGHSGQGSQVFVPQRRELCLECRETQGVEERAKECWGGGEGVNSLRD